MMEIRETPVMYLPEPFFFNFSSGLRNLSALGGFFNRRNAKKESKESASEAGICIQTSVVIVLGCDF